MPTLDEVAAIANKALAMSNRQDGEITTLQALDGGGGGITSLGGLTDATQTLSTVDDTNVTVAIVSAAGDHEWTVGWTGTLAVARGGTGATTAAGGFTALSPMSAKGDIISRSNLGTSVLAVGSNDQVLTADSTTATGLAWKAASGGGSSSAVFYALGTSTAALGTSMSTIAFASSVIADTGYSLASNEVTIGSELDGQTALVQWAVGGTDAANNRVEIRSSLQVDTGGGYSTVKTSSNYVARNNAQNTGGVQGHHYLTLATGMKIRVTALRDGASISLLQNATSLAIQTV